MNATTLSLKDEIAVRLARELLIKTGMATNEVRVMDPRDIPDVTRHLMERGVLQSGDINHMLDKAQAEYDRVSGMQGHGRSATITTIDESSSTLAEVEARQITAWMARDFGKWSPKKQPNTGDSDVTSNAARNVQQGRAPAGSPSRVGQPWHAGEDDDMLKAHAEGHTIGTIAAEHKRTSFAIACRLQKHKVLDDKMKCNQGVWHTMRRKYGVDNNGCPQGCDFIAGAGPASDDEFTPIRDEDGVETSNAPKQQTVPGISETRVFEIAEHVSLRGIAKYDEAHSQERDEIIANLVGAEVAKQVKDVQVIAIARPDGTQVKVDGLTHYAFPRLLRAIKARTRHDGGALNIWLYGPAGTGKSTAARKLAGYLDKQFYTNGPVGSQWDIRGFTDATGKVVSTQFREAWINGGVYCWDEGDGSAPAALIEANGALATGFASFPDGVFVRHPECIVIINGNLRPGAAPDATYNGRFKQDTAFVNRFIAIEWGIDESLETALLGELKGDQAKWLQLIRRVRERVKQRGIKGIVVSPRQAQYGVALLDAGADLTETTEQVIKFMFTDEQWQQVAA